MSLKKIATVIELQDAKKMRPLPSGNLAMPVFSHGAMEAELYQPQQTDPQTPHSRDEIYLVAAGGGEFYDGVCNKQIGPGSYIFVPAGVEHRFLNFTNDLAVWVIFYGPEGGE